MARVDILCELWGGCIGIACLVKGGTVGVEGMEVEADPVGPAIEMGSPVDGRSKEDPVADVRVRGTARESGDHGR